MNTSVCSHVVTDIMFQSLTHNQVYKKIANLGLNMWVIYLLSLKNEISNSEPPNTQKGMQWSQVGHIKLKTLNSKQQDNFQMFLPLSLIRLIRTLFIWLLKHSPWEITGKIPNQPNLCIIKDSAAIYDLYYKCNTIKGQFYFILY